MSLCLLPSPSMYPFCSRRKRSFLDSFFDDFHLMEQALRPLKAARQSHDSAGKLEKVVNDDSKLSLSLNVKQFKPEELSVNVDGRTLKIEGKQEIKEKNGYTMRTFIRQWTFPKEVDVEQVKSTLTDDGHLAVEAPKMSKKSPTSRSIEIQKATPAVKENGEVAKQKFFTPIDRLGKRSPIHVFNKFYHYVYTVFKLYK